MSENEYIKKIKGGKYENIRFGNKEDWPQQGQVCKVQTRAQAGKEQTSQIQKNVKKIARQQQCGNGH